MKKILIVDKLILYILFGCKIFDFDCLLVRIVYELCLLFMSIG